MRKGMVLAAALLSGIAVGAFFMFSARSPQKGAVVITTLPAIQPATVYEWRDKNGTLHISNERPPAGTDYRTLTADGTLTSMDPVRIADPADAAASPDTTIDPLKVYTPGGAQQLVQDAQNAAQRLKQHQLEMQRRSENPQ